MLCLPDGVATNNLGDVFIADTSNSRVLRYNHPVSSPPVANAVLGQLDMFHNGANGPTAAALEVPQGLAIDSSLGRQRLYVADSGNNRVLGWLDGASFVNGDPADIMIGQPDANSIACNEGVAPADLNGLGADSLCGPKDVAVDAQGHLFVSDSSNNRVLEYDDPFSRSPARVSPRTESSDKAACSRPPDAISALPRSAPQRYADPKASPLTALEICSFPIRPTIAYSNSICRSRRRISRPARATRSRIEFSDNLET